MHLLETIKTSLEETQTLPLEAGMPLILEEMQITITVMLGILEIVIHKTVQFLILPLLLVVETVGHGEILHQEETVLRGIPETLHALALDGMPVIEQEIDIVEPQVLHLTTHEAETIKIQFSLETIQ